MTKSQQAYPTDLNDTEWARIAPYLPEPSSTGAPRQHGWRTILNAIFYIVRNGCVWRALPHDFPTWKTVYHYFQQFRKTGLWEQLNTSIREAVREKEGKQPQASLMIADSQSAKSAEGGEQRGFDGGKLVSGRKRNLLVDTLGLVVLAKVTAANVQDVHAGKQLFSAVAQRPELLTRLEKIVADGGYRGTLIDWVQQNLHVVLEIVLKLGNQKGFQVLPKRWVVERTFAWITRNRRLARDYERLAESSEAFIYVAMIRLGLRRLAVS
ncbi:MAG: IS5 family transposase [Anaerolineales bacterium]|nr:MAG: IS5 family transposase [Anaerolineales bacterium]